MVQGIAWVVVSGFGGYLFKSDILQNLIGQVIHLSPFKHGPIECDLRQLQSSQLARLLEDGKKHGPGELAGVGVLQRRMITRDDFETAGKRVLGAMRESETGASRQL